MRTLRPPAPAFVLGPLLALLVLASSVGDLLATPSESHAARPAAQDATATPDPRVFPSGYRIDDDAIWSYYQHRGGARTLGEPISHLFRLRGLPTQLFLRGALQVGADGAVSAVGLADSLLPYVHLGGVVVPPADPSLAQSSPDPASPDYATALLAFLDRVVPDTWQEQPLGFNRAVRGLVTAQDAFPEGGGDDGLLPLFSLELTGLPTSAPAADPSKPNLTYQRFQRVLLWHDASANQTDLFPLGALFKALLTGQNLPMDLEQEAQAAASPFLRQYAPAQAFSLARPAELPDTDLSGAFNPTDVIPSSPATTPGLAGTSAAPPLQNALTPPGTPSPLPAGDSGCLGDEQLSFAPTSPKVGDTVVVAATSARQHIAVNLFGSEKATLTSPTPRAGQLGWVWEWSVVPSLAGPQVYTFYVDATRPCATTSFSVGEPLVSPTPKASSTPKPTKTPKPEATATPSPTPMPDANRSALTLSKQTLRGDGQDSLTVTATILDKNGHPVVGAFVQVAAKPGTRRDVLSLQQANSFTDSNGTVQALLSGCNTGNPRPTNDTATITASTKDDQGQPYQVGGTLHVIVLGVTSACL